MTTRRLLIFAMGCLIGCITQLSQAAEVIVVCPRQFRSALEPWQQLRQAEGLSVTVCDSEPDGQQLCASIRQLADHTTRFVVLVGDAPTIGTPCNPARQVPTNYIASTVTASWGSTPTLPTDLHYGDFDGDGHPEAAVGRLPVDTPQQLRRLVRRIQAYESSVDFGAWRGEVQLTGGIGGFGWLADTAIEAVTRTIVTTVLPAETRTKVAYASPGHRFFPRDRDFTAAVLDRYQRGARFWVYAGHGWVDELDRVPADVTGVPVLDKQSVQQLRRSPSGAPIALLLACYTGAIDAKDDSLAEHMLLADGGPVAVLAGSRVTMPYGNATAAVGLIDGVYHRQLPRIGDAWLSALAQMDDADGGPAQPTARAVIDSLAAVFSGSAAQLDAERREHMQLYNLIGDPTLRLHQPQPLSLTTARVQRIGEPVQVTVRSPIGGRLNLSLDCPLGCADADDPNETLLASVDLDVIQDREVAQIIELPSDVTGTIIVRALVAGKQTWATAATTLYLELATHEDDESSDAAEAADQTEPPVD